MWLWFYGNHQIRIGVWIWIPTLSDVGILVSQILGFSQKTKENPQKNAGAELGIFLGISPKIIPKWDFGYVCDAHGNPVGTEMKLRKNEALPADQIQVRQGTKE